MRGTEINELSKNFEKLAVAAEKGPEAVREMTAELLKSIPVAGSLGEAMARFDSVLSGEVAYLQRINAAIQATDTLTAGMALRMKAVAEATAEASRFTNDIERKIQRLSLSGTPLKLFDIDSEAMRAQDQIQQWIEQKKNTPEIAKQKSAIEQMQKQLAQMPTTIDDGGWAWRGMTGGLYAPHNPVPNEQRNTLGQQLETAKKRLQETYDGIEKAAADMSAGVEKYRWAQSVKEQTDSAISYLGGWITKLQESGDRWRAEQQSIRDVFSAVQGQIDQLDMTAVQRQLEQFSQLPGVTADQIQRMGGMLEELDRQSRNLEITDTIAAMQKPVDQFNMSDSQKRLDDLARKGASAEQLTQAKGLLEQIDALNAATAKVSLPEPKAPEFMRAGSAQAFRYAYEFTSGQRSLSKDDVPKRQLAQNEQQTQLLKSIDGRLSNRVTVELN